MAESITLSEAYMARQSLVPCLWWTWRSQFKMAESITLSEAYMARQSLVPCLWWTWRSQFKMAESITLSEADMAAAVVTSFSRALRMSSRLVHKSIKPS